MAGNKLGLYDPLFYAQEALIVLHKQMCFAGRVHRGYDATSQQLGSTIMINKPGTFVAQDAPSSVAQDLNPSSVSIVLDQWKEVKFQITDKELAFTKEKIINDHIAPAAYALADCVDQAVVGLYKDTYNFGGTPGVAPAALSDLTHTRRMMNDLLIPDDGQRRFAINSAAEENFLLLNTFNANPAPGTDVAEVMMKGHIGNRFGLDIFASQNAPHHTKGTATAGTALQLNGAVNAGDTTLVLKDSGGALSGTMVKGDVFSIAGSTQTFVVTATATAAANVCAIAFQPAAPIGFAANAIVTVKASHDVNVAFHRNAFALATAPLSDMGNAIGARIASIVDPFSGLSLRSRVWYDADASTVKIGLDILYGLKTLDAGLAVRYAG